MTFQDRYMPNALKELEKLDRAQVKRIRRLW